MLDGTWPDGERKRPKVMNNGGKKCALCHSGSFYDPGVEIPSFHGHMMSLMVFDGR